MQRIVKEMFTITYQLTIPISTINLSKSILLVNNCIFRPSPSCTYSTNYDYGIIKCTLQSSSILLEPTHDLSDRNIDIFEAQVIEFY